MGLMIKVRSSQTDNNECCNMLARASYNCLQLGELNSTEVPLLLGYSNFLSNMCINSKNFQVNSCENSQERGSQRSESFR